MKVSAGDDHRLIFSANPGRSGSGYLAGLLDASPDVDAGHERLPAMTDRWLRRVSYHGPGESLADRRVKAAAIRTDLIGLAPGMVYVDTSHMFLKTFSDVVLDEFPHDKITIVELHRGVVETARSFMELDEFGLSRRPWHDFLPVATAPDARFRLSVDEIESQFDLVFAYLADTAVRTVDLRRRTPDVAWVVADLPTISSASGALDLFVRLGLRQPENLDDVVVNRPNQKLTEKATVGQSVSDVLIETRLRRFCERFAERPGIDEFQAWFGVGTS